jgi:hypothetical protein
MVVHRVYLRLKKKKFQTTKKLDKSEVVGRKLVEGWLAVVKMMGRMDQKILLRRWHIKKSAQVGKGKKGGKSKKKNKKKW